MRRAGAFARRRRDSRFNHLRVIKPLDVARGTVPALLPSRRRGDESGAGEEESVMKIIHGSLSSLLTEVKEQGKVDGVRVAAMMQSTFECAGLPRYTSWVIVSAHVDWEKWAEWRLVVGRQRGEVTERGYRVPEKLAALTEEKLAEVRGWIEAAGLLMRDGILAGDAETLEGVLG
jgi:hypothetical protein